MNWDISTPEGMENAVAWQKQHVSFVRDGGVWIVPRSGCIITIYHSRKVAVFNPQGAEPDIEKVFLAMGWTPQ